MYNKYRVFLVFLYVFRLDLDFIKSVYPTSVSGENPGSGFIRSRCHRRDPNSSDESQLRFQRPISSKPEMRSVPIRWGCDCEIRS